MCVCVCVPTWLCDFCTVSLTVTCWGAVRQLWPIDLLIGGFPGDIIFQLILPTIACLHMQHTTGDCSYQTCSHVLEILCIVWARGITWLGCYRLLRNDDCFSVHINITYIGRIWNINKRVDSNLQASREEYEAATHCARRSHHRRLDDRKIWSSHSSLMKIPMLSSPMLMNVFLS